MLLDRNPLESVFPFSFVEGDFNKIVAISTFVDVLNQAITGFEFMFRDGTTVCAGRSHPSTSKLSFCVDIKAGETLTGIACAEAKENSGVVVKVRSHPHILVPTPARFNDSLYRYSPIEVIVLFLETKLWTTGTLVCFQMACSVHQKLCRQSQWLVCLFFNAILLNY